MDSLASVCTSGLYFLGVMAVLYPCYQVARVQMAAACNVPHMTSEEKETTADDLKDELLESDDEKKDK